MPHVEQRLVVHRFVLEDREHRFRAIEQRMSRAVQIRVAERVEHAAVRLLGERVHLVARGPARCLRRRVQKDPAYICLLLVGSCRTRRT